MDFSVFVKHFFHIFRIFTSNNYEIYEKIRSYFVLHTR